jgi:hypothetical protein
MRRRYFLALTGAVVAGAIPVLRDRAPSPMSVAASAPPPPPPMSEEEYHLERAKRQTVAFTEVAHTPCYQGCMEARMDREGFSASRARCGVRR